MTDQANKNPKNSEFVSSDALILLAIVDTHGDEGVDLPDIIALGDYVDHSIFNGLAIRHGLSLLKQVGFINEKGGRFFLAGAAFDYWEPIKQTHQTPSVLLKRVESFLGVDSMNSPILEDDPFWEYAWLDDAIVHEAYQVYIHRTSR